MHIMTLPFLYLSNSPKHHENELRDWLVALEFQDAVEWDDALSCIQSVYTGQKESSAFMIGTQRCMVIKEGDKTLLHLHVQDCMAEFNSTLEELNAFRVMASALKHDVASSLNNIALQCELLSIKGRQDGEDFQSGLSSIKKSLFDANLIIDELSDFAQLVRTEEDHCSIDEVLLHTKRVLQKEITSSGAVIAHGTFNTLTYPPSRLLVILKNILSNSIKYSGNKRPQILIHDESNKDFYTICISDNGIGIPEDEIKNITKPFKRASNVGKAKGNGVGLSTVKSLMISLGGKLVVKSPVHLGINDQSGTMIKLSFPKSMVLH